jgi:glycosyltransferase involved in cell wall biosynthesis
MRPPWPRISAIIPVFNGERYLAHALASVRGQTLPPAEIIVVDDGSTDGSAMIAVAAGARLIQKANGGVASARNHGLKAATGDFIGFLDQDDVWPSGRLADQAEALAQHPAAGIVSGRIRVLEGTIPGRRWSNVGDRELSVALNLNAALIRRAVFETIGPLSESLGSADDIEWYNRARDFGVRIHQIDTVTLLYRWHGANTSREFSRLAGDIVSALKVTLDRRRHRGGACPLAGTSDDECDA